VKRTAVASLVASLLVLVLAPAPMAWAHTELVLSDPADGAALAVDPSEVLLAFSEELIPSTVSVSVADGTGFVVTVAAPDVDGADVSFPWPPALTGPDYTVNSRVVSQDGHPVSGSLSFTGAGPSVGESSASAPPVPSAGTSPAETSPAPVAVSAEPGPAAQDSGLPTGGIVAIAVGLAIGIAVGVLVVGRRRGVRTP